MARHLFGLETVVTDEAGNARPFIVGTVSAVTIGATSTSVGGQYTDLLDGLGNPTQVVTTDVKGRPVFAGPDAVDHVWADFGDGGFLMRACDLEGRVSTIEGSLAALPSNPTFEVSAVAPSDTTHVWLNAP